MRILICYWYIFKLGSDFDYQRATAVEALGRYDYGCALAALAGVVKDDRDFHLRLLAGKALVGRKALPGVKTLVDILLNCDEESARFVAASSLSNVALPESLEALVQALSDKSARVRAQAANSLGYAGDSSVVEALEAATNDPDDYVVKEANQAITQIGTNQAMGEHTQ